MQAPDRRGERFVYAYYDGVDKVAHEYGLGEYYDAELVAADRLVAELLSVLPPGAALVVTADHGQVDVADRIHRLAPDVSALVALQSGEGRFRWLHAVPGATDALFEAATDAHGDLAWVVSLEQVVDEGWFGPRRDERGRRPARRRGPRRPGGRGLRRPGRHRAVRAREPPWLGDERPRCSSPCSPGAVGDRARPRGDADVRDADVRRSNPTSSLRSLPQGQVVATESPAEGESVDQPAKVMRIGSMVKQLLDEVRAAPARRRQPRADAGDLRDLGRGAGQGAVARPAGGAAPAGAAVRDGNGTPSDAELRIAQAQLVGWLEGLFHGIQATLFAQQLAARQQLEQMRQLPPGQRPDGPVDQRPGTYL